MGDGGASIMIDGWVRRRRFVGSRLHVLWVKDQRRRRAPRRCRSPHSGAAALDASFRAALQPGGAARPRHPCRRRPAGRPGLAAAAAANPLAGPPQRGGTRRQRPRRLRAAPRARRLRRSRRARPRGTAGRQAGSETMTGKFTAACVQISAQREFAPNIEATSALIRRARDAGADLIMTPEITGMFEPKRDLHLAKARDEAGNPPLAAFRELARETGAWLLVGSLAIKLEATRPANPSVLIPPRSAIAAPYPNTPQI